MHPVAVGLEREVDILLLPEACPCVEQPGHSLSQMWQTEIHRSSLSSSHPLGSSLQQAACHRTSRQARSTQHQALLLSCRERWQVGAREDWRYADLRAQYPRSWWWLSFFAVYVIQVCPSVPSQHVTGSPTAPCTQYCNAHSELMDAQHCDTQHESCCGHSKHGGGTKFAASGYQHCCACSETAHGTVLHCTVLLHVAACGRR